MHLNFIHSLVSGRLGYFQVLDIINSVLINTGVHVSFGIVIFLRVYAQ